MRKIAAFMTFLFLAGHFASALPIHFKDAQYSFQLLRALGATAGGAADIGECLKTAYRIKEGDDKSWYREWSKTADDLKKAGDRFLSAGDQLSASEAYLRASNYYRTAEFFLHTDPSDRRIMDCFRKSKELFLKAVKLAEGPVVREIKIPYQGTTLPGYYCTADRSGQERPLLIIHSGYDGTKEELYYANALPALKRGYNCLLFEGPGQGEALRVQKLYFRPDWEKVVTPVVDYALTLPETIPDRIALMGISFGGYLAPRAAAFEPRIKACIANGGVWDFHENFLKHAPAGFEKELDDPAAAKKIDQEICRRMKKDAGLRWVFANGMWTFGVDTPSELIKATRLYAMKKTAGRIKCRMLAVDSAGDTDMPGQAIKLYRALKCPKEYMLFTAEEGAEEHCQMGAGFISSERIYGWLDKNL